MTINHLLSREQFAQFHAAFKALAHNRALTPSDMLVYNIIRGLPSDRGFTAITNTRKIQAGSDAWLGLKQARQHLKYLAKYRKGDLRARFGGALPDDVIDTIAARSE